MMTAEEAAERGKDLSFEKVWAIFEESDRKMKEASAETDRKMAEAAAKTDRQIKELSKNLSGLGLSLGKWSEEMVAAGLCEKVNVFGYTFTKVGRNLKFFENKRTLAEADVFLENGDYVMIVEVKVDLEHRDIDEHLERLGKIRRYMDARGDKRTIVGAAAGAVVSEGARQYAHKKGLYVVVQSGDSVAAVETPEDFIPRKW